MFVCICNGHREREIAAVAARGVRCVRAIYAQLGGAPRCGKCLEMAEAVVSTAVGSSTAPTSERSATD